MLTAARDVKYDRSYLSYGSLVLHAITICIRRGRGVIFLRGERKIRAVGSLSLLLSLSLRGRLPRQSAHDVPAGVTERNEGPRQIRFLAVKAALPLATLLSFPSSLSSSLSFSFYPFSSHTISFSHLHPIFPIRFPIVTLDISHTSAIFSHTRT